MMVGPPPDPLLVLKSNAAFRVLPPEELVRLASAAKIERYQERTLLVERGKTAKHIWFVGSGSVDLTLTSANGGIARLPITPGHWATWAGCFSSEPLLFDFWSSKSATLVAFSRVEILRAVAENPDALLQVIEFLSENVAVSAAWILSATIFSAEQRLAYLLLVLSARFSAAADPQSTAITQEQLGMLGLGTRQRVSRLLRSLASRGLVEMRDGRLIIPSRERLEAFAY
jgi:CRP-like cAMP-binding protein